MSLFQKICFGQLLLSLWQDRLKRMIKWRTQTCSVGYKKCICSYPDPLSSAHTGKTVKGTADEVVDRITIATKVHRLHIIQQSTAAWDSPHHFFLSFVFILSTAALSVFILGEGEPHHHQVLPVLRIEVEYVWWNGSNSDFIDWFFSASWLFLGQPLASRTSSSLTSYNDRNKSLYLVFVGVFFLSILD
jgi:hypothetical protein